MISLYSEIHYLIIRYLCVEKMGHRPNSLDFSRALEGRTGCNLYSDLLPSISQDYWTITAQMATTLGGGLKRCHIPCLPNNNEDGFGSHRWSLRSREVLKIDRSDPLLLLDANDQFWCFPQQKIADATLVPENHSTRQVDCQV